MPCYVGIRTDKTRLQEYTQRACVQLPLYQTLNEGPQHAPQFKSQVLVDGIWYTSPNAFSSRKIAEHDAAKHAFIGFREKLKAEGRSLILEVCGTHIVSEFFCLTFDLLWCIFDVTEVKLIYYILGY